MNRQKCGKRLLVLAVLGGLCACVTPERPPQQHSATGKTDGEAASRSVVYRMPGEFEPVTDVLLAWNPAHAVFLSDMIAEVRSHARVTLLMHPGSDREEMERELAAVAVDTSEVALFKTPVQSIWVRDFGPKSVLNRKGAPRLLDLRYRDDEPDDLIPIALAKRLWKRAVVEVPLTLDGGNLLADGKGHCLTTISGVMDSKLELGAFRARLRKYFGCTRTIVLPEIEDEPTGHVDMMVTITGPARAIVAQADESASAELSDELDWTAILLEDQGFRVSRVILPPADDGIFRSYTNAVAVNGVVLVPAYPEFPDHDAAALEVFAEAYPDRDIVAIDASGVIEFDGALHCATQTLSLDAPE